MPQMSGLDVYQKLKMLQLSCKPDIIMLTAYSGEINGLMDDEAESINLLSKPVTPSKLLDMLNGILYNQPTISSNMTEKEIQNLFMQLGKKRILLVEDNPINREVTTQLLEFIDMDILTAENGQLAVAMAHKEVYDLVLMDVQMPIMDGLEATKLIRKIEEWKEIPIIAMTAHAFEEDIEMCKSVGMNDHIAKPVQPQRLYSVLLKWLCDKNDCKDVTFEIEKGEAENKNPEDSGEIILLQSVEGLDVQSGLMTLNGNLKSYINLLGQFVQNHGEDGQKFSKLLERGAIVELGKSAHALKGVSATLGISKIQQKAFEIELGVKENKDREQLAELNQTLIVALDQIVDDLKNIFKIISPIEFKMSLGALNIVQMNDLIGKIEQLLLAHDTSVNDLIEESGGYLIQMFGDEALLLCKQIEEFEYENAKMTLKMLMNLKH
jgi:CheY-like chemotaxis protein